MSQEALDIINNHVSLHNVGDCPCCQHSWKVLAKIADALYKSGEV